ncbi:class I SAM-dependent methyltransferase [Thiorhodovibrio frisius]|uniref:Methyltransferase family protein n=1 Tax=Thiorhodovibrio frisius TaxID=631362 RepID=H8YVY1_9GAMM|nr:class I SAM-dependent methyltransferase [Thiorhodovibrio frisius]EIC23772.1 methyltransferase family protein [Thiorhodovibrio frisius]WPL20186.1 putative methyltransferase regulatory domain protein [Thiorhodovibrio frisius]
MTDWTAGYVADIGYTHGYYTELNPARQALPFLNAGLAPPQITHACELGFGQGLSVNLHAAATGVHWSGTDFNPSQAAFAQTLASAAGSDAQLFDDSFAELAARDDLPDFDFIGVHGIWSWISDDNRRVMVDFIRRKLKVGGVLYLSYNTLPGWAAFAPMRHLMTEHADALGAEGQGIVKRIYGAIAFAEQLLATNPLYSRANPQIRERLETMKAHNRHYLAHEYFNRDWHPMHFATLAEWLAPAKLRHAGSAHLLDAIDAINLTQEQQTLLNQLPDPDFRQSVRDFMVNQQFRRDYWIKGPRRLNALEQAEALRAQRLVLIAHRPDVPLKVTGSLGEANLSEAIYTPILDQLADHQPKTIGQLETSLKDQGISFPQLLQATLILTGAGHLAPVQTDAAIAQAKARSDALNRHLMQQARGSSDVQFLASPVTGGGIQVNRFEQLFLLSRSQGQQHPSDWAEATWQLLHSQGQRLLKEGKAIESEEENRAELNKQAEAFAAKRLPMLKALQVV